MNRPTQSSSAFAEIFLNAAADAFRSHKTLAERAIRQLSDEKLRQPLDGNTNSIAVVMKHIAGNLISRWTDFLTSDGEKPWRNRDDEFVDSFGQRSEFLAYWEQGWQSVFESLQALKADDLMQTVTIRGEPHAVPLAIERSLAHTCYHVGQVVLIARVLAGDHWETLTIAKGESAEFNRRTWVGPFPPAFESRNSANPSDLK